MEEAPKKKPQGFIPWVTSSLTSLENRYSKNTMSLIYCSFATTFGYMGSLHAKIMIQKYSPFQISQIVLSLNAILAQYIALSDPTMDFSVKSPKIFRFLVARNILSTIGQLLCFYYLSQFIPLSLITVIYGFTPIIVFVLETIIYKAQLHATEIIGSFFSSIGIVMVIDVFGWGGENSQNHGRNDESTGFERIKYCAICLLACTGFACANVIMRELHDLKLMVIQFNWGVIGNVILALTMMIDPSKILAIALVDWIRILIFNVFFQFLFMMGFTRALQIGKKGRVVVVNNLQILYAFLVEIIFYEETPSLLRVVGSVVLVGGVMRAVL